MGKKRTVKGANRTIKSGKQQRIFHCWHFVLLNQLLVPTDTRSFITVILPTIGCWTYSGRAWNSFYLFLICYWTLCSNFFRFLSPPTLRLYCINMFLCCEWITSTFLSVLPGNAYLCEPPSPRSFLYMFEYV